MCLVRRVLQRRIVAALEVLEDGVERAAGGAPPQAATVAVVAPPHHWRVVDGDEPLHLPTFELRRPRLVVAGVVFRDGLLLLDTSILHHVLLLLFTLFYC